MKKCAFASGLLTAAIAVPLSSLAAPRVVVISLDGGTPSLVKQFMHDGTIPRDRGLSLLAREGTVAERNITINPSLTAAAHVAMTTGSTAARNDVVSNTFHLVASPFVATISGFSAPIGGYSVHGPAESDSPTAEPLWLALRAAGMRVVTATFPGGDGLDVRVPGLAGSPIIQSAAKRTVDLTVPFGTATSPFQKGFQLNSGNFTAAPAQIVADLAAAGHQSFSPVRQASLETFTTFGVTFSVKAVALDTTNDNRANYDTIVIYDDVAGQRILGPFTPAPLGTGPAVIKPGTNISALFFLEGNTVLGGVSQKAGTRYFVSNLAPDLTTVRIARTSMTFINRAATTVPAVLADIDDIHTTVGFWQPQPDFRIVEKLDAVPSTFLAFPDLELEAIYEDLVVNWTKYQTNVVLRALAREPNADLAMFYFEQPDGSEHQFLLTDPRQATDPTNPATIGAGQDQAKVARYHKYLRTAYRAANEAVQRVIEAVGTDRHGVPHSNVIVASDHGFAPFHTAVNMGAFLASKGFDPAKVRAITSGPAAHIYISLQGREPNGTVTADEYVSLQQQLVKALRELSDANPNYHGRSTPVFDQVFARPTPMKAGDPELGLGTDRIFGQDSGDVYATLSLGYNFDGTQTPVVGRLGDDAQATTALSVPNFYGAHGYDPKLREMSAIFYAAGPQVCRDGIEEVRNIDLAPTVLALLGVQPADTVQGRALRLCGRRGHDDDGKGHGGHGYDD
ncbi:MAG TPA: alkaline phosphatase family protein [Burkholderiales bacterium]|nr:alkaline phosphatase family protein [Burkholderiales bacterium]